VAVFVNELLSVRSWCHPIALGRKATKAMGRFASFPVLTRRTSTAHRCSYINLITSVIIPRETNWGMLQVDRIGDSSPRPFRFTNWDPSSARRIQSKKELSVGGRDGALAVEESNSEAHFSFAYSALACSGWGCRVGVFPEVRKSLRPALRPTRAASASARCEVLGLHSIGTPLQMR